MLLVPLLAICSMVVSFNLMFNYHLESNSPYYYQSTPSRASSWLIGIIAGYLLFKVKQRKLNINKLIYFMLWTISTIIFAVCIYFLTEIKYTTPENRLKNTLTMTFRRPLWCMALCWVIYDCYLNRGGRVNRFLSLPIFEVLSRLTFATYVVHCNMIELKLMCVRTIKQFGVMDTLFEYAGFTVLALIAGMTLTLSIEMPLISLEKHLWKRNYVAVR